MIASTSASSERATKLGPDRPVLRRGMSTPEVKDLQRALEAAGFSPGAIDGDFGPKTESAVIAFQSSRGLVTDGIVGPITWNALGSDAGGDSVTPHAGIALGTLCSIMVNLSVVRGNACLPYLNAAMDDAAINNRMRCAAFLAQLAHESGELKYFEEIADGSAYEGRRDLGNTEPGDGKRYKGRGPIQLTGRSNYRAAGRALGLDLEGNPEQAANLDVGFRVAGWFWTSRNLNPLADAGTFTEITRKINGGLNGQANRERYYQRALAVL